MIFFLYFSPGNLLIILYKLNKFEAISCYNFWNILITKFHYDPPFKVLWIFKNIFETFHGSNDSDEKIKMLKTRSQNSNRVKSYACFIIMQISI